MRSYLIPVLACLMALPLGAQAADRPKAEALVKEGIAFLKANGKEKFIAEVQKGSGKFHVKPGSTLYLAAYDMNGVVVAHGADAALMGLNRLNVKDPDGVQYIKAQITAGQQKGGGWVNFKRLNPDTRKIEAKTSYCLAAEGLVIFCGVYL
jgi:signal transduction histidine kinase